jgi:hypothetical protein
MEEGGDLLAERAARLIVLGFAQSRLVGSLNEVLVDRDSLRRLSRSRSPDRAEDDCRVTAGVARTPTQSCGLRSRTMSKVSRSAVFRRRQGGSKRVVDAIATATRIPIRYMVASSAGSLPAIDRNLLAMATGVRGGTPADVATVLQRVSSGRIVTGIQTPPMSPVWCRHERPFHSGPARRPPARAQAACARAQVNRPRDYA